MRKHCSKRIFILFVLLVIGVCSGGHLFSQQNDTVPPSDSIPPLIYELRLADTLVSFHWHNSHYRDLMFMVIHDDENTSSDVGYQSMEMYCASLLEMKNDNKYLYTLWMDSTGFIFNPNRIFSIPGTESILNRFGPCSDKAVDEIYRFSTQITGAFLFDPQFIVALHNNAHKGFSILSYQTDTTLAVSTDSLYINPALDPDDFFYVVDPAHFTVLKQSGFNVVLQKTDFAFDDGSLSWWCLKQGIPYVNIEAEHKHHKEQLFMLDVLFGLIISK